MRPSMIPLLIVILVGLIGVLAFRARRSHAITRGQAAAVLGLFGLIVAWAFASAWLAVSGAYASRAFYALLPALWIPFVPLLLLLPLRLAKAGRAALVALMDQASPLTVVGIQGLRIAAVGTLVRTAAGDFPLYFEITTGVPDLLYGLSAIVVARRIVTGRLTWRCLMYWHLIGLAILVPAGLFIQLGLPGSLQLFSAEPTAKALFEFPMVLAPTVVVPLFAFINSWAALWLRARRPDNLAAAMSPRLAPLAST